MPALEDGKKFGRYRVVRQAGSGSSGESYEAEDSVLQRRVILKLLHPSYPLSDRARRQFFRIMPDISSLSHPYLAAILDYGENEGQLYIIRRYVPAGSLLGKEGRLWFRPPFAISNAIHYTYQLALALSYIHSRGFTHGSVTLSNILVRRAPTAHSQPDSGPLLLADVGIAQFVRSFGQPQVGFLPITAAPEQLEEKATPASDQYSLAILLYLWLAGSPPFLGSPEEIIRQKRTGYVPPLTIHNPGVTRTLHRALSISPDERYPSILEFAEALLVSLEHHSPEIESAASPVGEEERPAPAKPEPGPLPQVTPDVPQPLPERTPTPTPIPEPQPAPEPEPATLPPPAPTPDVPQPLPNRTPHPEQAPMPMVPIEPEKEARISTQTEILPAMQAQKCKAIAFLTITSPYAKEPREVSLQPTETRLGRAGASDLLLDYDPRTSRHHALIKYDGERYAIYDKRSISGTIINGTHLKGETGHILADGDYIQIGQYTLVFRLKFIPEIPDIQVEHTLSEISSN